MSVRRHQLLALCIAFFASLAPAFASAADPLASTAADAAEFRIQADGIRASMKEGGQYAEVPVEKQKRVGEQLEHLQAIYDKRGNKPATQRQEVEIINVTSEINALLTGNDDARVICEQVKKTGSNRHERICQTVAQRNANRDGGKAALREIRPQGRAGNN